MILQTEFEFTLPKGYVDEKGDLHKTGVMRLATAGDEILPYRDPRVQQNPEYAIIILISRVITRLGTVSHINTGLVENLFKADFEFLQAFYVQINEEGTGNMNTVCPKCGHTFQADIPHMGEA